MEKSIRCNGCMNYFTEEELAWEPDSTDGEVTRTCPNCHTDTMLMDIEPIHICKVCGGPVSPRHREYCDECYKEKRKENQRVQAGKHRVMYSHIEVHKDTRKELSELAKRNGCIVPNMVTMLVDYWRRNHD